MKHPLPRVSKPNKEQFLNSFALQAQPVVICGAVSEWKCFTHWTDEYLAARLSDRKFLVNASEDGKFDIFSSRMRDADSTRVVTFEKFLAIIYDNEGTRIHYMQQKPVREGLPELIDDIDYVGFLDQCLVRDVNFWFSQRGSNIPLHYDTFDNLLVQVRGTKFIRLIRPSQTPFLYPGRNGADFASMVDLDKPDLDRYPLFRHATIAYESRLEAGEILYIPAFWWHDVVTDSRVSLSVNYWYHVVYGSPREPLVAVRELFKVILHYLGELPPAQRDQIVQECGFLLGSIPRSV